MSFFTTGVFWFIEGILFCLTILGIRAWAQDRAICIPTWKWAFIVLWLLFSGFTLAFIGTCLGENERHAALLGGAIFGLIAVISGVGLYRLVMYVSKHEEQAQEDA